MKTFEFDLIDSCNLKCEHCVRQEYSLLKNPSKRISLNDFESFISNWKDMIGKVKLQGMVSEPLLHPEIVEIVKLFNQNNISVEIYTNGSMRMKRINELKQALNKNKNNGIFIALEGSTYEMHAKYRIGADIKKVLNNLRILSGGDFRLIIQHIYFEYNAGELDKIKDLMESENIEINYYDLHYANQCDKGSKTMPPKEIQEKFYNRREQLWGIKHKKIKCYSDYTNSFYVSIEKKIYPCTNLLDSKEIKGFDMFDRGAAKKLDKITQSTKYKACNYSCNKIGHELEKPFLPIILKNEK